VAEAGDKVSDEEKQAIESAASELEAAIKSGDKAAINAKMQTLSEASSNLAQKMYAAGQAESQADNGATGERPAGDDTVDAEFEEVDDDKKGNK
jgi:molecular chaperone DnaK